MGQQEAFIISQRSTGAFSISFRANRTAEKLTLQIAALNDVAPVTSENLVIRIAPPMTGGEPTLGARLFNVDLTVGPVIDLIQDFDTIVLGNSLITIEYLNTDARDMSISLFGWGRGGAQ